jgi:hypothetical protein
MHYSSLKTTLQMSKLGRSATVLRLDRDLFSFSLTYRIFVLIFLIVFGFYGWGTFDTSTNIFNQNDLFVSLSILSSMLGIFILRDKINEFLPKVRISGRLFQSFLCFMCIGALLNFSQLRRDPDESSLCVRSVEPLSTKTN